MTIEILPWHDAALRELLHRREKLPHALLLYGRQGIGKVAFARAIAQSLLCESPDHVVACGVCDACGWFAQGNHPDFRELLPESLTEDEVDADVPADLDAKEKKKSKEIKIEQVRNIADFMTLSTHRDGFRVLLIHPAEAQRPAAGGRHLAGRDTASAVDASDKFSLQQWHAERNGKLSGALRGREVLCELVDRDVEFVATAGHALRITVRFWIEEIGQGTDG